jgi:uncharacterized membrane protein
MTTFVEGMVTFVCFFLIGLMCLVLPHRIQDFGIRFYSRHKRLASFMPFQGWLRSEYYCPFLRIVGFLSILISILMMILMLVGTIASAHSGGNRPPVPVKSANARKANDTDDSHTRLRGASFSQSRRA